MDLAELRVKALEKQLEAAGFEELEE